MGNRTTSSTIEWIRNPPACLAASNYADAMHQICCIIIKHWSTNHGEEVINTSRPSLIFPSKTKK
jgi:hypothetical protein